MDPSPFVLKIDLFLRVANIEFETIASASNLKKAPKGKLPFITDDDLKIADSQFIISYLVKKYKVNLDSELTDVEKSIAHLVGKSIDESLYWCLVYSRWAQDDTWPELKAAFFDKMPFPLKQIVPVIARNGVLNALQKQGLGKHSEEEILTITENMMQSLSTLLADKTYFFGNKLCTLDITAYAFLSQFISVTQDNKFTHLAQKYTNLVKYCDNISNKYYSK